MCVHLKSDTELEFCQNWEALSLCPAPGAPWHRSGLIQHSSFPALFILSFILSLFLSALKWLFRLCVWERCVLSSGWKGRRGQLCEQVPSAFVREPVVGMFIFQHVGFRSCPRRGWHWSGKCSVLEAMYPGSSSHRGPTFHPCMGTGARCFVCPQTGPFFPLYPAPTPDSSPATRTQYNQQDQGQSYELTL